MGEGAVLWGFCWLVRSAKLLYDFTLPISVIHITINHLDDIKPKLLLLLQSLAVTIVLLGIYTLVGRGLPHHQTEAAELYPIVSSKTITVNPILHASATLPKEPIAPPPPKPVEAKPTKAQVKGIATKSLPQVAPSPTPKPRDQRAISLEKFLIRQKSPLSKLSDLIVSESDKYGVDYKIPVAIAGAESGYCMQNFKPNNCWGYGSYGWESLETAVKEYLRLMSKNYFKKGATTIEKIAPAYSSNPSSFIEKVRYHYGKI